MATIQEGKPVIVHSFNYKVKFLGGAAKIQSVPEKASPSHNNYFIGNDRTRWAADCKLFQGVTYKNVYPNIDVRYYSDAGHLKYDFIVYPGGNVSKIAMQYDGPPEMLLKEKELIIKTPVGDVKELYPYSYQTNGQGKQEVECKYVLRNNVVTFQVKNYDPKQILVIDPSIKFSTFTGSIADNWSYTATPGPDGTLYAGGIAYGIGYQVSPGAFQTSFGGGVEEDQDDGYDIAIFKFSSNGSNRVYATYLGGSGNEQPHSMIVDAQGNLIVAGRTFSANYPVTIPRIGPPNSVLDYDIVITKFNAAGNGILGSVKIGGTGDDGVNIRPKTRTPDGQDALRQNYGDDARSEVILDGANNIILSSCTQSPNFPVTPGTPIQSVFGSGRQDGVILKFNPNLSTLLFSTFFGGSGDDACFVASINPLTGNLYIAGATTSTNLPGNKLGVIRDTYAGGIADGFVTEIRPDGSGIIKTTYIGTSNTDLIYGLKFDRKGYPYIMGTTTGSWNVFNAVYSNPGSGQFIAKLEPNLSAFVYSTVFGSGRAVPDISPIAFLVDRCENVYVSGWGGGVNLHYNTSSTNGLPLKDQLSGLPPPDGKDFYFFVLEKNAQAQLFGSHFGQNGGLGDHVDGGTSRFDENGVIYQAICANCGGGATFPTTPGAWSRTNGSPSCNQAAVKIEMNFAGVGASLQASIDGIIYDTLGCVPFIVDFRDTLGLGKKYYWDFGDGSFDTTLTANNSHPYNAVGTYQVMLIAEDLNTCNVRDTAYVNIKAGDNVATLKFRAVKDTPCTSLTYSFTNLSTSVSGSFGPRTFIWNYGDGSAPDTASFAPPRSHTFPGPGEYVITLSLLDDNFCNSPVSIKDTLRVNPLVEARFSTPPVGCAPYTAFFDNMSLAGTDFLWEFGDSQTSTAEEPTHTYNTPGIYNVRLIATDTSTCNKVDTSDYFAIRVSPKPTARFTWSPNPPLQNTPTNFTNQSSGAIRYLWDFDEDGATSTETDPTYQFNSTRKYKVTLVAFNADNCSDTFSLMVDALILPLLDVPNAFTPGRFGLNGLVFVKGFGIGRMDWRIYNRWGQVVFRTSSRKESWDGTFKGKPQPMDVYAYTLDVEFTDGKKLRKTGDITLLR